ncbi:MAG: c-type cytochrome biogenesis protein CcmI [Betaproteobacteria bacterium]
MDALFFWLVAAAMTAGALAFVLPRLLSRSGRDGHASRAAMNAALMRGELAELDRDRAEGRLDEPGYRDARHDIERRLLAEAVDDAGASGPRRAPRAASIALAIALPAAAFGLYAIYGDPGALNADRVATASVDGATAAPAMREELVRHLERSPRDGRGWVLLARIDFDADGFPAAVRAYERALATPKVAADAGVWCEYADALGMAQGGLLAGKPQEAIARALAIDPGHPKALEMAGSAAYEAREYAVAATHWRTLLAKIPAGTAASGELAAAVARAERLALAADPNATRR